MGRARMRHAEIQAVCPVARASEILADRWTPLIVRELFSAAIVSTRSSEGCRESRGRCWRHVCATWKTQASLSGSRLRSRRSTAYYLLKPEKISRRWSRRSARGASVGVRRPEAGGVGRGVVDLENSPADQSRALAGQTYGRRVRLHGPSRPTRLVAARAPGSVGMCDSPWVRFRSRRSCESGGLLPCLVGTHQVRRRYSVWVGGRRRASRSREAASAMVHVEPDGAFRSGTRGGRRWIVGYPETVQWHDCTLARLAGRTGEPRIKTLIELPTFAVLAPSTGRVHPSGRPVLSQIAAERVQPAAEHFTPLARSNSASHRAADADESGPRVASARPHRSADSRVLGDSARDGSDRRIP